MINFGKSHSLVILAALALVIHAGSADAQGKKNVQPKKPEPPIQIPERKIHLTLINANTR